MGIPTNPLKWSEIKEIIDENKLEKLGRSKDQLQSYHTFKNEILQEWDTIVNYILYTKFNYTKSKKKSNDDNSNDNKWISHPPPPSPSSDNNNNKNKNNSKICFCLNDHPYYFEHNIEHWVLWKLNDNITNDDINYYKNKLINDDPNKEVIDTLHWINPISLKSIPELDHVHILCLKKVE